MASTQANGSFEVELSPEPLSDVAQGTGLGRMSLNKKFDGDLVAASQGEMLSFRSSEQGSAGYVAMETVTGTLHGRHGSFVLQHSSAMTRGTPEQSISVVPGSGTGHLVGLAGRMVITIAEGQHSYKFDYKLP
ncbi:MULTISPECIES: DUF3224 domain-containing protein [unclassified Herbaspirillum]|uniref:DUF3224 domain-containing protein n=1 Tax=unclassified Herbaspirillum TaxID=2624150 RepID=UPI001153F0FD|nr:MULTISPECIES: DUF3224 domain-containing protein [unclassified Herbaspirillum]MBB5393542.1 hypothetical protein [Herbaspirillum sp. SJZ102]TQK03710.1 uncharacterized protein DUF3224 [Herbaspirillum sp. SJZ130]TQK08442.1 uncharacterized protein DUF3224 [Herbaspirillum sp. SJZ106]